MIRFGPAGNGDAFYAAGNKSSWQTPAYLAAMGLTAYEYQCGRGVRISDEAAAKLGEQARLYGVALSVHAPYFISLASAEEQKRENSIRYMLDSARAVSAMGGERIVVHPGGLGGLSRAEATALAVQTLKKARRALDEEGYEQVIICPETMGKIGQLGDLDEVLTMCEIDERFLPCVDFGHLNCRTHGGMNSAEAYTALLDTLQERLGESRARVFHAHFSKIEYSAGGEKKHLTLADEQFGPEPMPLMEELARRGWSPTVICESDGTQELDAAAMQAMWQKMRAVNA